MSFAAGAAKWRAVGLNTVIVVELQRSETLRLRPASKDREASNLPREQRGLAC